MSFRALLNNLPEERVKTVTFEGQVFEFKGTENAELLLSPFTVPANEKQHCAKSWSSVIRTRFKRDVRIEEGLVWKVKLVAATLQVPSGEKNPEEVEIAVIATLRGRLFAEMFAAAADVCGLTQESDLLAVAESAAEGN